MPERDDRLQDVRRKAFEQRHRGELADELRRIVRNSHRLDVSTVSHDEGDLRRRRVELGVRVWPRRVFRL